MGSSQQKVHEDPGWTPSERMQRLMEESDRLDKEAREEYKQLEQMEDPMEKAGIPMCHRDIIRQNEVAMIEFNEKSTVALIEEIKKSKRELAWLKLEELAAMPLPEKTTDKGTKKTTEKVTDGSKNPH
ncbi:MAG: hypothetical protein LQ350_004870 [Teloschistes chrysophthalmus]|nr:MAG: hypothetical protein LQ350_004870 [Niorma chrysophthalma]